MANMQTAPGVDYSHADLFGVPLISPSPALLKSLAHPDLLEICACARLIRKISRICRRDSKKAGHAVLIDSIPVLFAVGIDHELRGAYAALAGLVPVPEIETLDIARPSESEISGEMARVAGELAGKLEAAAEFLQTLSKNRQ